MSITREYLMIATPGSGTALQEALVDLAKKVLPFDGCEDVKVYRDMDSRDQYIFCEHWSTPELYQSAGQALGKEAFVPVSKFLAQKPTSRSLLPVPFSMDD